MGGWVGLDGMGGVEGNGIGQSGVEKDKGNAMQ